MCKTIQFKVKKYILGLKVTTGIMWYHLKLSVKIFIFIPINYIINREKELLSNP